MEEIFAETNRVREEQLRRHLNPWLRDQEEQQSWSEARTFQTTKNVLPGEQMLKKARQKKGMDATQQYLRDGTPAKRTGICRHWLGGKKKT